MPETSAERMIEVSAVEGAVSRAAAGDRFSGVVHLAQGNEVLFEQACGVASRRWSIPVKTSMRFDVASLTKLFTSVAVLQQVDAGTLSLDSRITEFVDLSGTQISEDVTIRHLLTHTSGIADDADEEADESYEALWVERPNYSVTETADFLPQFVHKPPNFAPGHGCRYCNVGYILAGLALESVTGQSYRDYVRQHVFGRAGMRQSGFFDMREAVPDVAEGWEPASDGGWRQNIYSYPPIGSPDGGAHVIASDLVRFLAAVRGGVLLSPELTTAFLTPQVKHHDRNDGGAIHFSFGLEFEIRSDGSVRSFYKDGVNTGVSAIVRYYPELDATLAVVANSEKGAWDPVKAIDAIIAP